MQLFVRGQNLHTIDANEASTVAWLKDVAAQREGFRADDVVLYNAGRPLMEREALFDVASNLDTLDLCVKMLGGKVHGSLARAGKVKGQTPKVEKDKDERVKKKKTGRAKRRMQYNRRYVNVVAGFGRKKGPNSQES